MQWNSTNIYRIFNYLWIISGYFSHKTLTTFAWAPSPHTFHARQSGSPGLWSSCRSICRGWGSSAQEIQSEKNIRELDMHILYCAAKMENNLRIHLSLHGFTLPANISWQIWKWDISNLSWWSVTNGHIQHFNNHLQIIIIILQFYIVE